MCVTETSPWDTKYLFNRKRKLIRIFSFFGGWGGGGKGKLVLFLCLPLYNLNFRYFDIKSLFPRTLNLQDSAVDENSNKQQTWMEKVFPSLLFHLQWLESGYLFYREPGNPNHGSHHSEQGNHPILISLASEWFWSEDWSWQVLVPSPHPLVWDINTGTIWN